MQATGRQQNPSVAIIGGGFSGIVAAIKAKQAGTTALTLYERSASVGGTWWDNQYPGAEVDTPSLLYSYSFAPRRWSRTHVRQAELQQYLEEATTEFGLRPHLRLGTGIERVEWVEEDQGYVLTTESGEKAFANVVISAVGFLNQPKYPEWPGLSTFAGSTMHSARWDPSIDLQGKRVAVVGTGSTAVQVVPGVADAAGELLVFQREPGWMLPKGCRDFTSAESAALDSPLAQRIVRTLMLLRREKAQFRNSTWRPGTATNVAAENAARRYINRALAARPDLIEAVTPSYPFGGKRPIIADDFYPTLLRDHVRLIPRAVERVTEAGVVDVTGQEHPVDVLIFCTGFRTDFTPSFDVVGRNGRKLDDIWQGEPEALFGLMIEDMPNFFMMYGPNSNGGAIVTHLEAQAQYVAAALRTLRRGATSVEPRPVATRLFNRILQKRLQGAAFVEANNYYKTASGRIMTQWSDGAIAFSLAGKLWRRPAWIVRNRARSGLVTKLRAGIDGARVLDAVDTGSVWAAGD